MGLKKTIEMFKNEVREMVGDEYIVLGEYINNKTYIDIMHRKCGKVYKVRPDNFKSGSGRCSECYKKAQVKSQSEFEMEIYNLVGTEYRFLKPYINNSTRILALHNKCGNTFKVSPTHFLHSNRRCTQCYNTSYFQGKIKQLLNQYNITYETEKTFIDCKSQQGGRLRFDFCIYLKDGTSVLIEYDGKQHDDPVYGEEELERTQANDKIKDEYCKLNHIELLRLKYIEDNKYYLDVLTEFLNRYKLVA